MLKNSFLSNSFSKTSLLNVIIITLVILTIPLVAMQLTAEVNWGLLDFVVMGSLIFCTISMYMLLSKGLLKKHSVSIALACAFLFLFVWAELAVGIFTNLGS